MQKIKHIDSNQISRRKFCPRNKNFGFWAHKIVLDGISYYHNDDRGGWVDVWMGGGGGGGGGGVLHQEKEPKQ